ncbi:hypothetical protein BU16DRAFT_257215 [Lophium mytilinum]|uniref:Uncharacterized protein n=1 Tax=Lophium mytilinum TaxID=390894 RepID=A0A6A6RAL1_9PEZI|nr:hypothetical protein BU16DRAFT_257215 [Lophium mytilinum]
MMTQQKGVRALKIYRVDSYLGSVMRPHPISKSVAVTGLKIGPGDSTIEDLKRGDFSEYHLEGLDPAALYLERTIDVDYLPKKCVMFNLSKEGALHALMEKLLRHRAETIELLRSQPPKAKAKLRKRADEVPKTASVRMTTSSRIRKPRQRAREPPLMKQAILNNAEKYPRPPEESDSASSSDDKKVNTSQKCGDDLA